VLEGSSQICLEFQLTVWLSEIEHTMYVLNVDLWSEDATKEVNLVRHTTATPSISSTTQASFGSIESVTPAYAHILPSGRPEYPPQVSFPPTVNPYSVPQGYGGMFQLPCLARRPPRHSIGLF
jgi:hypothetical protein